MNEWRYFTPLIPSQIEVKTAIYISFDISWQENNPTFNVLHSISVHRTNPLNQFIPSVLYYIHFDQDLLPAI